MIVTLTTEITVNASIIFYDLIYTLFIYTLSIHYLEFLYQELFNLKQINTSIYYIISVAIRQEYIKKR